MSFQPLKVNFYGSGCKIVNYYNLKCSPGYTIPKDSRGGWLLNNIYPTSDTGKKTKSNYQYTELYNTREQYIHDSKKQKAPSYSFGKAGIKEDEFYTKTKIKKRAKSARNKNFDFNEENFNGDNCENNLNNNKNDKKEENHNQYYEIGTKFVNESRQIKAPLYSFARGEFGGKNDTVSKIDKKFFSPHDFYETRKYYINESKKPRVLGYSFGKEKRIDPNIKKKWKYKIYGNNSNNKNNVNKTTFNEEKNFDKADKCSKPNEIEKENNNENEKINTSGNNEGGVNKNLSKDYPHDFYNVREHYIYESKKPTIIGYSFGKNSGVKPKIIKGKYGEDTFFYNLREHYIYESQKPKAPKYSFGRPFVKPKTNNKNKKYKLRPQSAVFNRNLKNQFEEVKNNNSKKSHLINGPGPGSYDTRGIIGENALKISISPCGRKYSKGNGFPGPNYYAPEYNVIKKQYPIYSIGKAERDGCYEGYYPINNSTNMPYGTQYYRRNPSWIVAKNCKGELFNRIIRENNRYIN